MRYILIFMTCICCIIGYSQYPQFEWAGVLEGNMTDLAHDIAIDSDNNVYVVGSFGGEIWPGPQPLNGVIDLDPGFGTAQDTSVYAEDIFIAKLDQFGNFIWGKTIGGVSFDKGNAIETGPNGNIFICGIFQDSVDFDPGPGTQVLISPSFSAFVLKLDDSGNFVWVRKFENSNARDLVIDENENIYTTGFHTDSSDMDPGPGTSFLLLSPYDVGANCFVNKLDSQGNLIWTKSIGNFFSDQGQSIAVDLQGNVVVTGSHSQDTIGALSWPNPSWICDGVTFVEKMDSLGNTLWHNRYIGSGCDGAGIDVAIDHDNDIYVTGQFAGTIDFDLGAGVANLSTVNGLSAFVLKLDQFGGYEWANNYGSLILGPDAYGSAISVNLNKNVYVAGSVDSADFDPTSNQAVISNNGFVLKLDSLGGYVWAIENPVAEGMEVSDQQDIYLTGYFNTQQDFDPNLGTYYLNSMASYDGFIQKLSQCATYTVQGVDACNDFYWSLSDSTYTGSTTDYFGLTNANGCDSVVQLDLIIHDLDTDISLSGITLTANLSGAGYQWIDCSTGQPIPGETNQSFIPLVNGNYALVLTTPSCQDTTDCYGVTTVGIEEDGLNNLVSIYPNPTNHSISIELNGDSETRQINIYNTLGQVVKSFSGVNQNLQNIILEESGVYYVEVITDEYKGIVKVIRE